MRAALHRVRHLKSWVRHHQLNDPIGYTPDIELPTNKAAAIHAIATRYGSGSQNGPHEAAVFADLGPEGATSPFVQAARCVNEALRGGFLGDLDSIEEGEENMDKMDEEDTELSSAAWSSDDESFSPSTSARGLAEQVIARTTYNIKRQLNMFPDIHAALDHVTHRDLVDSLHRSTYEQYANELEALAARVRGLLCHSAPLISSSQRSTQPLTPSQHTRTIPLPPSPEKRQYRKDSRSFH
ncbi:hypothetical protein FRC11_007287 [Ceratobasidium sp. 423]|nr:hypothetical protein FRC11_007287 [Ceratobasidium sp. 423]